MIGNKLEQSIISIFQNNLSVTYSINEISKVLKKSYPNINKKSNYFLKEGVLKKIDIGRSYRCYLDIENEKTKIFMSINELNAREEFLKRKQEIAHIEPSLLTSWNRNSVIIAMICGKRLIIVAPTENSKQVHADMRRIMPASYVIIVMDAEAFKKEFLEDHDIQSNHVIMSNMHDYLEMISHLNEKLLMKGLLGKNTETL